MSNLHKKNKRAIVLIFLTSLFIVSSFNLIILDEFNSDNAIDLKSDENTESFEKKQYNQLKISRDYSTFYNNTGQNNLSTTLHQSLIQEGDPVFEIDNVDNYPNNTFSVDCPMDRKFNSTFTNITLDDIYAPNQSFTIEDSSFDDFEPVQTINPLATSFQIKGDGYLENISLHVYGEGGGLGNIQVYLINSTWDSNLNASKPDEIVGSGDDIEPSEYFTTITVSDGYNGWVNAYFLNKKLNNSYTDNNTWFIGINQQGTSQNLDWYYTNDYSTGGGTTDNINETYSWWQDDTKWNYHKDDTPNDHITTDFHLKVDLAPLNNTPHPKDIGLKLNGSLVNGYGENVNGSGYWLKQNQEFGNSSGTINFTLEADWWDVQCNITKIQINYTKTDLLALSEFNATSNENVNWNVTIYDTLDNFSSKFKNHYINFTIPKSWDNSSIWAYNGTKKFSEGAFVNRTWDENNNFNEVQVLGAGNGTNWHLTVNSTNLLGSIETYLKGTTNDIKQASYSNEIQVNASFSKILLNNIVNLSIFNETGPAVNFTTKINATDDPGIEFIFDWDISETITDPDFTGTMPIQVFWHNETEVGFWEISFDIIQEYDTNISPIKEDFSAYRGEVINYTFEYINVSGSNDLITEATLANRSDIHNDLSFTTQENEFTNNYSIIIETINANPSDSPFSCNFTISKAGYLSIDINLSITVNPSETEIYVANNDYTDPLPRHSRKNQTIHFTMNDTTNNEIITSLTTSNLDVYDRDGDPWKRGAEDHNWTFYREDDDGNYSLDVSMNGLDAGEYTIKFKVSGLGIYAEDSKTILFTFQGNELNFGLMVLSGPNGELDRIGEKYNYTSFLGSNLQLEFNLTDNDVGGMITTRMDQYILNYENVNDPNDNGTLSSTFEVNLVNASYATHIGTLNITASNMTTGNYKIDLLLVKNNYQNVTFDFNLNLKQKYPVNISIIKKPSNITAGDTFEITLKAIYNNASEWIPLNNATIRLIPYFNGEASGDVRTRTTDNSGEVTFEITIPREAQNMTLRVSLDSGFFHTDSEVDINGFQVNPAPGFTIEQLLPFLIIGGIVVAAVGTSAGVYKGVIVPKKREKQRILTEVKTIFDDAVNLEHVLVLYKGSGTCVYFKSFGTEKIDPELISGFISAVSSFGREMESQKALNEISYGDKMILLADGDYVRVALVLGKKASTILRQHLKEFINAFEKQYEDVLPKWRGQLKTFRNAGDLVDEHLHTSIILPHEISYELADLKKLKSPHSKDVLEVANELLEESERSFFFISKLLEKATEELGKDLAETFMGIKELRDKNILIPIEIDAIEEKPVSKQEVDLIRNKVKEMADLDPKEEDKVVNDLAQMGPAEREAYLASLQKPEEIVTAPIRSVVDDVIIEDEKTAKKQIKKLMKRGKKAMKKEEYPKAKEHYQEAAYVATNWELTELFHEIEDILRIITIEELKVQMAKFEKEAKRAEKADAYEEAAEKYQNAASMASEIFKMGVTEMTEKVKTFTNKYNEFKRLSE